MTITLRNMKPRIELQGRPPAQQPPRDCSECGRPQSRYRHPTEMLCSSCAAAKPPAVTPLDSCSGCGRTEDYQRRYGMCGWCLAELKGSFAYRCETCSRVFGLPNRGKTASTTTCSSCRSRKRVAAMTPEEREELSRTKNESRQRNKRKQKGQLRFEDAA